MNLATWVERNGRRFRDAPALAEGERVHASWAEFATRTAAAAAGLRDLHALQTGARVAIVMRNRPEYLEALYAVWHAGLVAVPVNARLHRDEIAYILDDSGTQVVITDEEHAEDVEALADFVESLQATILAPSPAWDRLLASTPMGLVDRASDDPAWLFYTSGTTGRPKGATLTHHNLLMCALSYYADIDPVEAEDCILHAAPLSHGSGLYGLPHVAHGAVSVMPPTGTLDGPGLLAHLVMVLASSAGGVNGAQMVAVPNPIRAVCPATYAKGTTGSWTVRYDGSSAARVPGFCAWSSADPSASVTGDSTRWNVHNDA